MPKLELSAGGRKKVMGCLITMWRDGQDNATIPMTEVPPPYRTITHENRHVTLRDIGMKAEEDMTEHLRTHEKLGQIFSRREIERRIQDVFWKIAFTQPDGIEGAADNARRRIAG